MNLPAPVPVWPVTTISMKPAPPDISLLPGIAPVSSKLICTGRRYSGGRGRTSPPPPFLLPQWPRLAMDISNYPPWSSSAEFFHPEGHPMVEPAQGPPNPRGNHPILHAGQ